MFTILIMTNVYFLRSELPENQYEHLKSEIIHYVITFCHGTRIVLTRLCIAVSLLLAQRTFDFKCNIARLKLLTLPFV